MRQRTRLSAVGFAAVLAAAALVMFTSAAQAGGQERSAVCHVDDEGIVFPITVADPAVDKHIAHGDSLPNTDGLDENCEPLPPTLTTLAVAYSNLDGVPGYDPNSSDVLIAKLDDTNRDGRPSAGDTLTTNQYPIDFAPTRFGDLRLGSTTVDSVGFVFSGEAITVSYMNSAGVTGSMRFESNPGEEIWSDEGSPFDFIRVRDFTAVVGQDEIQVLGQPPSDPSVLVRQLLSPSTQDNTFLEVDVAAW